MKKTWQCPKCNGNAIGYFEKLVDQSRHAGLTTRKIGRQLNPIGLMGLSSVDAVGDVEAFVCTTCGFFEEYVQNPAQIAWNQLENFRWCKK